MRVAFASNYNLVSSASAKSASSQKKLKDADFDTKGVVINRWGPSPNGCGLLNAPALDPRSERYAWARKDPKTVVVSRAPLFIKQKEWNAVFGWPADAVAGHVIVEDKEDDTKSKPMSKKPDAAKAAGEAAALSEDDRIRQRIMES